jgi:transaldolase/glucose-6-phosphate isomerase
MLGAIMGEAAVSGRDKLTLIADPQLAPFGSWLEQLIAESSGKQGRGIIVVDGEPPGRLSDYQYDRLFIYLKSEGMYDKAVDALIDAGHSVLVYKIPDSYTLVSEFFRWEIATVAACHILGVNAFDQPDVQDNKSRTVEMMTEYARTGRLDDPVCRWEGQGRKVFTNQDLSGNSLEEILEAFLGLAGEGDYIAINAFVPRNSGMLADLNDFRLRIRSQTGRATTLGFGPRFLHSTGQLHKGGPDSGLFLQITADPVEDIEIPKEGITPGKGVTFGVLERAQALGDFAALAARRRRILRLHLPSPEAVRRLGELVK